MTIIQPSQNQKKFTLLMVFLGILLGLFISGDVFIYNSIVDLNHNVKIMTDRINKTEVVGADLKNKKYELLDPRTLEALALKDGLIKDKGPQYFQITLNP
jgi:hypothetical protein